MGAVQSPMFLLLATFLIPTHALLCRAVMMRRKSTHSSQKTFPTTMKSSSPPLKRVNLLHFPHLMLISLPVQTSIMYPRHRPSANVSGMLFIALRFVAPNSSASLDATLSLLPVLKEISSLDRTADIFFAAADP